MEAGLSTLESTLRALRQAWPDEWPGLPTVVRSCLGHLGVGRVDPGCALRIRCLHDLARLVESDGRARARAGVELPYHNRLHVADALVSLAVLIRTQQEIDSGTSRFGLEGRAGARRTQDRQTYERQQDEPQIGLRPRRALHIEAMIAMLAHDYLHDGTVNRYPGELEARSCRAIDAVLVRRALPVRARARIRRWIMATDPIAIARHHDRIKGRVFSADDPDCLQVLINEADILVSTLPSFRRSQTEALASERAASGIPDARSLLSPAARRQFLARVAIFSSDASHRLGLARLRTGQLEALDCAPSEV